ncbi:hypothetical protein HDU67_010377 [Dinochytrium kinnereticum]|nr:hypothetical protein HDU67_010377 [Dinochytrium kinnereticum]
MTVELPRTVPTTNGPLSVSKAVPGRPIGGDHPDSATSPIIPTSQQTLLADAVDPQALSRSPPPAALQADVNHPSFWSGFHKKALRERQNQLRLFFPSLFSNPSTSPSTSSAASTPETELATSRSTDSLLSLPANLELKRGYGSTASLAGLDVGTLADEPFPVRGLDEQIANNMIENCVGTLGVPVGLALNFVINSTPTVIPMAVEEPSVVAAVSGAAKTFGAHGGFKATTSERNIIFAQVTLCDVADVLSAAQVIRASKSDLIHLANTFVPGMVSRGGGVVNMTVRTPKRNATRFASNGMMRWGKESDVADKTTEKKVEIVSLDELLPPPAGTDNSRWLVVHFHLDVCDAMGANAASTVAEGVASTLASMVRGTTPNGHARIGLRIVSNLCVERLARATFRIPVPALGYKSIPGRTVAGKIIEATQWASDDPFRAATHNKGIMNGIDAVAVATGQDWRAIEASAHAWAAVSAAAEVEGRDGVGCFRDEEFDSAATLPTRFGYRPLTRYWVEREVGASWDASEPTGKGLFFCGELELPISVGTRGGVLSTNPVFNYTLGMMGYPDSKALAMAMVAVGLAQNFAALRALSTEGIQRGHMSLHARNIAIAAGAPPHAINECVAYMVESQRVNVAVAREYLQAHELHSNLSSLTGGASTYPDVKPNVAGQVAPAPPSTFYFEESVSMAHPTVLEDRITLNIAFQTLGPKPVHISLVPGTTSSVPPTGDALAHQKLVASLFGEKGHAWIASTFSLLDRIQISAISDSSSTPRSNFVLARKLKLISTLLNIVVRNMMAVHPKETRRFVLHIAGSVVGREGVASRIGGAGVGGRHAHQPRPTPHANVDLSSLSGVSASKDSAGKVTLASTSPTLLQVGRPLILALWQVLELRALQWIGYQPLATALLDAQLDVIMALVEIPAVGGGGLSASGRKQQAVKTKSAVPPTSSPLVAASPLVVASDDSDEAESDGIVMKSSTHSSASHSHSLSPNSTFTIPQRVTAIMSAHARRFQVSVFLLCDASTLDPSLLQTIGGSHTPPPPPPSRSRSTCAGVDLLRSLGARLEWEQTCAHDLSPPRLARDLGVAFAGFGGVSITGALGDERGGVVNGFLVWLGARLGGGMGDGGIAAISARLSQWFDENGGDVSPAVVSVMRKVAGHDTACDAVRPAEVESALLKARSPVDGLVSFHSAFLPEIREFLGTVGEASVRLSIFAEEEGRGLGAKGISGLDALFGPKALEKVTTLYREYYGVSELYA